MAEKTSSSKPSQEPVSDPNSQKNESYRVLARKYRPETFDDLIGQDALVQTLTNAFETGRIAQAYMLTGVRGVGKTTTARLIARGLNYETDKGDKGPSLDFQEIGAHCRPILESRHIDVLEMDAASNTGIDDVREIIESVRYAPVSSRYKVYIIDEVHMLSRQAFNGLLKTLEEPPPHVKFIFATTEVRKVPITVLSRCQRFDLRRVDTETLFNHFKKIAKAEGITAEDEALRVIVRASEGSVRDGLSLLDQAIAHGGGKIETDAVQNMLGLTDRSRIADLAELVFSGDIKAVLVELRSQFDFGADPSLVISDLATYIHTLTKAKIIGEEALGDFTADEKKKLISLSDQLSLRSLARAWQILLKGLEEVELSVNNIAAAEMVLIRLCHSSDLPTPDELVKQIIGTPLPDRSQPQKLDVSSPNRPADQVPEKTSQAPIPVQGSQSDNVASLALRNDTSSEFEGTSSRLSSYADIVSLARTKRDIQLCHELENNVRLVSFVQGHVEISLDQGAKNSTPNELSRKLEQWTGQRWIVAVSKQAGAATLAETRQEEKEQRISEVRTEPLVKAALETFPGAEIVDVTDAIKLNSDN